MLREFPASARSFGARRTSQLTLSRRTVAAVAAPATGAVAFIVYLTTLAPTVMWYDMGEFVVAADTLGIAHNTGYPLLILLGKAFTFLPAGDAAYRVNMMSAVFTALAITITFATIHELTDSVLASAVGALTLAFAATVWANATWASSYGVNLFFTALITHLMFSWYRTRRPGTLIAAAFTFGLALCNHRLIVLVAPASLLLIALGWRNVDRRTMLLALAAFAVGLSVYLYLPIRGAQDPALSWARPGGWHTYLSMFLNGQTPGDYWRFNDIPARLDVLRAYPSYDLTWAGIVLASVGLVFCAQRHRAVAAYCTIVLALDALIVLTYSIHNIYNYLTPAYLMLCVFIGIACARTSEFLRTRAAADDGRTARVTTALARPGLAISRWLAVVVPALFLLLPAALIARNHDRVDRSGDYSAYDFARTTLDRLPPRAVVLTDSWSAPPLWYVQLVEGDRRDVWVTPLFSSPGIDPVAFARVQLDAGRPVYVAEGLRTPIGALRENFVLQPVLLNGIQTMVTDTLPRPAYRDHLVPRGSLYRLLETAPDPTAASVPTAASRHVEFDAGVTLVGFERGGDIVDDGGVIELTYYWLADRPFETIPFAVTVLADSSGAIAQDDGWPASLQSRRIGEEVLEPDTWTPGEVIRESYFLLVPRGTPPGRYDVRVTAFKDNVDPARGGDAALDDLANVGEIVVR